MGPSCSTQTGTTSKRSATHLRELDGKGRDRVSETAYNSDCQLPSFIGRQCLAYCCHCQLYIRGDATALADHIRASESLLRIGISSELVHEVIWVFVVLALYRLLKPVNETYARQMLILGALVSVPIVFINVLNEIAAMMLVSGANFLGSMVASVRDARHQIGLHSPSLRLSADHCRPWVSHQFVYDFATAQLCRYRR